MSSIAHGDELNPVSFGREKEALDGYGDEISADLSLLKILDENSPQIIEPEASKSSSSSVSVTNESVLGSINKVKDEDQSKISAYARLDFENYTFYVQTLQVILGRRSNDELMQGSHHTVDVHISSKKAISRKHAKIFYNFGTQRFEISILGRNGAFVDDLFVEKGVTLPLVDGTKIQIGDIPFAFLLPSIDPPDNVTVAAKPFNPTDAINLRTNLYSRSTSNSPTTKSLEYSDNVDPSLSDLDRQVASLTPLIEDHTGVKEETKPPLMGKPARMGKPAIPPRYGRPANLSGSSMLGIPAHLVQGGSALKVAPGSYPGGMGYRPSVPRLEAQIRTLTPTQPTKISPAPVITVCTQPVLPSVLAPTPVATDGSSTIKKREPKKSVHTAEEIPEKYRIKPNIHFVSMISLALKKGPLTISEIQETIKELFPYYKYCPDGWQVSISHNLLLNKMFSKVDQREDGWTWKVDEEYFHEKENVRQKQQELANARAKETAIRLEEAKLRKPTFGAQSQFLSQLRQGTQKQKTIAELASEISRDGRSPYTSSIKEQLAANRSQSPTTISPGNHSGNNPINSGSSSVHSSVNSVNSSNSINSSSPSPTTNSSGDTKKALAYVQKELFTLYKARKLNYDTTTTTEIITKALTTTIAQVKVVGAKAGCGDNALGFLVERAPQQVSKILDIALSKSIRDKEASVSPSKRSYEENYPPAKR